MFKFGWLKLNPFACNFKFSCDRFQTINFQITSLFSKEYGEDNKRRNFYGGVISLILQLTELNSQVKHEFSKFVLLDSSRN